MIEQEIALHPRQNRKETLALMHERNSFNFTEFGRVAYAPERDFAKLMAGM
jgi:hypothetical protein